VDPAVDARVMRSLSARFGARPYWVMHALAADTYKTWPLNSAKALLIRATESHPEYAVALTGSTGDRAALLELAKGLDRVHVIAGELAIDETAACLSHARCVVAPDTGVLHLAAALGVPVVGLYGATSAALVGPRSTTGEPTILQKPVSDIIGRDTPTAGNDMARISVDEVLAAVGSILAR
jgi:ADP-heptose:LPS heptosyltransferase